MTKSEKKKQDFNANIWMLHDQKSIKTLNKIYAAICINIACVVHIKFNDDISKFVKYYIKVKRLMALAARRQLTKEQAASFAIIRKQYNSFFGRVHGTNISLNAQILKFNKQFRHNGKALRIPIAIVEHFILSKGISIQRSGKNLKTDEHHSTNYVPKHDKIFEVVRYGYRLTKWKLIEEADTEAIRKNELNKLCNEILG